MAGYMNSVAARWLVKQALRNDAFRCDQDAIALVLCGCASANTGVAIRPDAGAAIRIARAVQNAGVAATVDAEARVAARGAAGDRRTRAGQSGSRIAGCGARRDGGIRAGDAARIVV